MEQVVTFTFFHFDTFLARRWALGMMQMVKKPLRQQPGLAFGKLMGSGGGDGFQWYPDFSVYCLMTTWESAAHAEAFFHSSDLYAQFVARTTEQYTVWAAPIRAHGSWEGQQPFRCVPGDESLPVAVLTRATIRWQHLRAFWRSVPAVSQTVGESGGQLFGKGIGEWPLVQQATFSVWRDLAAMRQFAYRNPAHRDVARRTHQLGWFAEEMFVQFQPFATTGTWQGTNPLAAVLTAPRLAQPA